MRKVAHTFPRGGRLRPSPYGNKVVLRAPIVGISMVNSAASPLASRVHKNQSHT